MEASGLLWLISRKSEDAFVIEILAKDYRGRDELRDQAIS